MNVTFALVLIGFVSYFIGTINFSKIIAWYGRRKDITRLGSGNPGTMNMLRSFGFKLALFAFIGEVFKAGITCIVCKVIMQNSGFGNVAFWLAGLCLMLGYNFPVWSKFLKGGKGVATFAGIFLFSDLWYVALAYFVVCFFILIVLDYAFVVSFIYVTGMAIATTIYVWVLHIPYAWVVTAVVWFLIALTYVRHYKNIDRLVHHRENKIDFKGKLKAFFCHKKGEEIITEDEVNSKPEKEIVIEEDKEQK